MGMPAYEAGLRGGLEVYSPQSLACPVGLRRTCQAAVHVLGNLKRVLPHGRQGRSFRNDRLQASTVAKCFIFSLLMGISLYYGYASMHPMSDGATNQRDSMGLTSARRPMGQWSLRRP